MASLGYQSWDTEEIIIWANAEQLPYTFLDILLEKRIDGSSIHLGLEEMPSTSERRLAQNAYNILKQKGPDPLVQTLIWSFRIMKQGLECTLFQQHPGLIQDDLLNKNLCQRFQKTLTTSFSAQKMRPAALLKAFYENLHLVHLFPLFESDFDIEIGSDGWKKLIDRYKTYGKPQKTNIPSFTLLNTLMDPKEIVIANKPLVESRKRSVNDLNEYEKQVSQTQSELNFEDLSEGSLNSDENDNFEKEKDKAHKFVLGEITSKSQFYIKENVEMMFMQLIADIKGDKTTEIQNKMLDLFGDELFQRETSGLSHEIDVHSRRLQEKIDILKGKYSEFYKRSREIMMRKAHEEEDKQNESLAKALEKVDFDIDYEGIDINLDGQDNCSDIE